MKLTLNSDQLELLQQFADDYDYSFSCDYSGRNMFGKECIGFTLEPEQSEFWLGMELGQHLLARGQMLDAFRKPKTDSMGLGTIIYFPNISIDKE